MQRNTFTITNEKEENTAPIPQEATASKKRSREENPDNNNTESLVFKKTSKKVTFLALDPKTSSQKKIEDGKKISKSILKQDGFFKCEHSASELAKVENEFKITIFKLIRFRQQVLQFPPQKEKSIENLRDNRTYFATLQLLGEILRLIAETHFYKHTDHHENPEVQNLIRMIRTLLEKAVGFYPMHESDKKLVFLNPIFPSLIYRSLSALTETFSNYLFGANDPTLSLKRIDTYYADLRGTNLEKTFAQMLDDYLKNLKTYCPSFYLEWLGDILSTFKEKWHNDPAYNPSTPSNHY